MRHPRTGEITTTRYNAHARRILLQAGFEEAPGCACPATEAGTDPTHGTARQSASCSPTAYPGRARPYPPAARLPSTSPTPPARAPVEGSSP
ncbi:hypothetical protein ACWDRR_27215 [Kitasatospora sp. NPDC003701]|uniref:hypothetical protein n=1 Tax=Kitasatospora sp. NPDC059973 TaxID=3347020 RepID=UPI0036991A90